MADPGHGGKHLEPWRFKPGHSGFRGRTGIKRRPSLTRAIIDRLEAHPEELEQIMQAVVDGARAGNPLLLKLLWDRLDGLVGKQSVDLPAMVVEVEGVVQDAPEVGEGDDDTDDEPVTIDVPAIECEVDDA